MLEMLLSGILIMLMRVCDVTIGTFRTILIVQGRKVFAGLAGFVEVLIWIFAIRTVFQHLDNYYNLFGYAIGFGMGNVLGITLEQKIGLGYSQLSIISRMFTDEIATMLRKSKIGVTILPGEGGAGGVAILMVIIPRKKQKQVIRAIEEIDSSCFITVQSAMPYRGFIHGPRK
ncbi:MAG: DUF2179 domain-containing protein [Ignavibacteriaceae bacterium]